MLTEAELNERLETLPWGVWLRVDPNRPDIKHFIQYVKNRIDKLNDFVFSGDYSHIMRIETVDQMLDEDWLWQRKLKYFDKLELDMRKRIENGTFVWPELIVFVTKKTKK